MIHHFAAVWDSALCPDDLLVALALADIADEANRVSLYSPADIAYQTNLGRRRTEASLDRLKAIRFLLAPLPTSIDVRRLPKKPGIGTPEADYLKELGR